MVVGDVIVGRNEEEAKVLVVLGEVFLKSYWGEFDKAANWWTFAETEGAGWRLEEEPKKIKEVTMEEVCKKFGEEVKIKKNK